MAIEIKYVGGSRNGQIRRTRSTCDVDGIERIVWREFDKTTGTPTGRERRESYKLDHQKREYVLMADVESSAVN
jgi:hypothetical protein